MRDLIWLSDAPMCRIQPYLPLSQDLFENALLAHLHQPASPNGSGAPKPVLSTFEDDALHLIIFT
ncbi:hypothetical protein [Sphingobium sp. WCS2017Hpa-17]|uniref:hypothetical protein n=1 Tax=Sphingobium sp. WCS2017Hpa-17 TaxID=3073638 RepID=UPI002889BC4D|nr:hypothetical protein [Sphingobium sp. WCS2017Hpa-17]